MFFIFGTDFEPSLYMKLLHIYIGILFSLFTISTFAQDEGEIIIEDEIEAEINLDEVVLFDKLIFKNYEEKVDYYILRRKIHKVYPYAKLASERLTTMKNTIDTVSSRRVKKKYIKRMQKYMEDEFSEELKKMSKTEGQILIKLIHRQTGLTVFDLIKEYRSGWKAFWYNTSASIFDLSLKEEYNPKEKHEDFLIEDVLQRAFSLHTLEKQESKLPINYGDLVEKWKK